MNKKLIIVGGLAVLVLGVVLLRNNPSSDNLTSTENVDHINLISPEEFAKLAKDSNSYVIDVHTPEQTHIPGTDAFIPFDQIVDNQDKLPENKSTPILVYCRSGSMSKSATKEIASMGYTNVYDLEGGTNAYKEQQVSVSLWPDTQALGTVVYGDIATTSFTLTNYTPLPLEITRISTSCGCTKASSEKEKLGAYESTNVTVTFDPAVHKDDTDLGDLTRTIYIETDNPNFPDLESKITATVIKKN